MIMSLSPKIRKNTVTEKELNRDAREQKANNKLRPKVLKKGSENKYRIVLNLYLIYVNDVFNCIQKTIR